MPNCNTLSIVGKNQLTYFGERKTRRWPFVRILRLFLNAISGRELNLFFPQLGHRLPNEIKPFNWLLCNFTESLDKRYPTVKELRTLSRSNSRFAKQETKELLCCWDFWGKLSVLGSWTFRVFDVPEDRDCSAVSIKRRELCLRPRITEVSSFPAFFTKCDSVWPTSPAASITVTWRLSIEPTVMGDLWIWHRC